MERLSTIWPLLKAAGRAFIEDEGLSRGAAIAFYAMTSIAPILYIAAYFGGVVMGRKLARGELAEEISRLAGHNVADLLQGVAHSIGPASAGVWPGFLSVVVLVLTAGAVFMEVQTALNVIWKASMPTFTVWRLLRSWAESLALVIALGALLLASMVFNALLDVLGDHAEHFFGVGSWLVWILSFAVATALMAVLFGAIYLVLPNRELSWRDVVFGAVVTAVLSQAGELLISLYVGFMARRYGSAGGVIVVLMWIYYSAQVFLLGAEITKVWSFRHGSLAVAPQMHKVSASP